MSIEPGETRSKIDTAAPRAPRFEKLCGLMAFLACARVPQRREKLMSLLWGSHFDVQAQQNLRKALSRLRHALGEDVFANGDELVSLRPGAVACDATAFERLIEEGSRESLRAATDLYKDMFLSDVSIHEEGWIEWMTDQRNRLEGLAVNALVRLGEAEEGRGDLQRALEAASRAVAMDELREDAHRLIIRCLAAAGRRAEALKRYDRLAALLKRELDVEPDASTRSLIDELRLPGARLQERGTSGADGISDAPHLVSTDSPGAAPLRPREDAAPPRADHLVLPETAGAAIDHRWRTLVPLGVPLTAVALSIAGAVVFLAVSGLSLPALKLAMHTGTAQSNVPGLDAVPIAVLPFTPLADDDDEESRVSAKMITDDLINILSRVPGLSVISRQSSQQLKSRPIDVFAVGKELGVRYVLDGSVRTQSEMLRVNVELIAAETRLQVWSDHFERGRVEGTRRETRSSRDLAARFRSR